MDGRGPLEKFGKGALAPLKRVPKKKTTRGKHGKWVVYQGSTQRHAVYFYLKFGHP